jgi:hypothetical protein
MALERLAFAFFQKVLYYKKSSSNYEELFYFLTNFYRSKARCSRQDATNGSKEFNHFILHMEKKEGPIKMGP